MLYHTKSKSLILKLKDPSRVTAHIPKSRVVEHKGVKLTQVHLGLDEARVLRNLGIQAPSPVRYQYDYPSRYPEPFAHQITTAEFFTLNQRCICLSEMGTAKTLSAIWAADYLMRIGAVRKVLVVAPLSTLESVWTNEIHGHLMFKRSAAVVHGSKERRLKALASDVDFYVINHHGVKTMYAELVKRKDIDLFIIDEAATFRNASAGLYKHLHDLLPDHARVWLMTGTPVPKAPTDAWALARLLRNPEVPNYFNAFKFKTMLQVTPFKWVPKPDAYETAYSVLQPGIRFRKEDCLDLPPVLFTHLQVELTKEQDKAYAEMRDHLRTNMGGEPVTAANAAVKLQKLLQVTTGVLYSNDSEHITLDATPRLKACNELIEAAEDKAIVFVPFTGALNMVAKYLRKQGHTVAIVDGSVSQTDRRQIFDDFQNADDPKVLVAHPATTAHGLTLTRADLTVWYGPVFSLELFEQANNRMNRPGQTKKMTVAMLVANTMEMMIYKVLEERGVLQDSVLQMYRDVLA